MAKKRVLLVDDEQSLTTLLKLNLEETGNYEVWVENCGEDAIGAAQKFDPDIVILDIIMPRVSGGDVSEQFAKDPKLKHIPIVFLTAAVRKHQVEDHEGIICERPCLAKPASLDEVVAMIEKYAKVRV